MKAPKYNDKQQKQVHLSERVNIVSRKECKKGDNDNDQNVYASISQMSGNDESPSRYFGDSPQLTNWILDSGATCHMKLQV